MTRFDRITAILVQLHTRRVVRAQDIAERFEVSLRTVYRDIRSLEEAGVAIAGEAGVGYSLMEGYRLPPVLFTQEEALALVMGEKVVGRFADAPTRDTYRSALYKIKAVLKAADKDVLERIEETILVMPGASAPERPAGLQEMVAATASRHVLEMRYQGQGDAPAQERQVEPIGLFQQGQHWYLIAFCRMRQGYRTFRTDRISELRTTRQLFSGGHPTLSAYLSEVSESRRLQKVVIEVEASVAKYLHTWRGYYGFITEQDKGPVVEMTFLTASSEGFARWFLMFATNARILEPTSMEDQVHALALEVVKKRAAPESLLT